MFISFEGIDCCGKTTQIRLLRAWLESLGRPVVEIREPGGTAISESIRTLLLDKSNLGMDPVAETLLFSAARSQVVAEVIIPALRRGDSVIADRFFDSTTAYQGHGRGLPIPDILAIHRLATRGVVPDLTIILDISVEESRKRGRDRGQGQDRMEQATTDFFERVREGYLMIRSLEPDRVLLLDGMREPEMIFQEIRNLIQIGTT